ncbi:MAG TPA: DUF4412 domain-containing protein [Cyclobacteriaceae bacterium]|nr:DUF4412 domain-containing protein [Cyclobacteriaceae bacterium]
MKKLILGAVLVFLVMTGRSQDFEGSIKMTTKLDVTDPQTKAKMDDAKKKANDPANQAKVKEMQEKMNDPQFKAMLDANPQMKAQMEAMMKMITMGDPSAMLPTAIITKVKGMNSKTTIEGGLMDKTEVIRYGDKDEAYTINHNAKTFTLMPKNEPESQHKPKVTKTSETAKIMNYNCTKYIIENTTNDGKTVTTNYWTTTEVKGVDFRSVAKKLMGNDPSFAFPDIPGAPMKIETALPQMGTITVETVEIKKGSIAESEFKIPSGYTEAKM